MLKLPNHILALSIIYIYYMIFNIDKTKVSTLDNTNKYGE